MKRMTTVMGILFVAVLAFSLATSTAQGCETCDCSIKKETAPVAEVLTGGRIMELVKMTLQKTCPIMGGKIDKKLFVDADGYRIYVCCAGCLDKVKADPAKAVKALASKGEKVEIRPVVCPKCGEIKGTKKCCAKDAVKCKGCSLTKGSIGCCKNLKPAGKEKDVILCPKCGQVKKSSSCCAKDAVKCTKCGLTKGSPGCCKLPANLISSGKPVTSCLNCFKAEGGKCKDCAKGAAKPVEKPKASEK